MLNSFNNSQRGGNISLPQGFYCSKTSVWWQVIMCIERTIPADLGNVNPMVWKIDAVWFQLQEKLFLTHTHSIKQGCQAAKPVSFRPFRKGWHLSNKNSSKRNCLYGQLWIAFIGNANQRGASQNRLHGEAAWWGRSIQLNEWGWVFEGWTRTRGKARRMTLLVRRSLFTQQPMLKG